MRISERARGTPFATADDVQHLEGLARPTPQLPSRGGTSLIAQLCVSALLHVSVAAGIVMPVARASMPPPVAPQPPSARPAPERITRFVFVARDPRASGGGGGGGNRQHGPIRRAEGIGRDAITLRIAKPSPIQPHDGVQPSPLPGVLLDARPLASGTRDVLGLPEGGVPVGTSLGPGSGGGVGEGSGTGIGPGVGPGVGPGAGGGIGGGVYRPGGNVTPPRVLTQVKPKYTDDALARKIQGTVVLQAVVRRDGRTETIVVVRSLDPGGLDDAAVAAAREWRFEPGRLAGTPVDVLVTLMLDFRIQ